jgi:hypothetical protein
MRTFRRVCDKHDLSKCRPRCAGHLVPVRTESTTSISGPQGSGRAHGGRPETGHPPAGNGRRDERKYRDEFNTEHMPEERIEYEDSVPMDRRPTLPVADVPGA